MIFYDIRVLRDSMNFRLCVTLGVSLSYRSGKTLLITGLLGLLKELNEHVYGAP